MPTNRTSIIPQPQSWKEFEQITLDALKIRWQTTNLKIYGRGGQSQNGVDIFGKNDLNEDVGIQCKNTVKGLSQKVINSELIKAESFVHKIDKYYIVTTAPRDVKITDFVHEISKERSKNGNFAVEVFFWDDVIQDLSKNEHILRSHYPQLNYTSNESISQRAILDLTYRGLSLKNDIEIIFGEWGTMSGEDPLQIFSSLITIKYSAKSVLKDEDLGYFSEKIEDFTTYMFPEDLNYEFFKWKIANQKRDEIMGIIKAINYSLGKKELVIYKLAQKLSHWNYWEVDNSKTPKTRIFWFNLKELISQINNSSLISEIDEKEKKYFESDNWSVRLQIPHEIYNILRTKLS